jgi:ATP-dependent helicase HrpB
LSHVCVALKGFPIPQAPPGAGKTTVVPLALLLHAPEYLAARPGTKIMVLEPRRVAAKAAARRMAAMLGERVGETVGYRVRLDTRVGPRTRIEVGV